MDALLMCGGRGTRLDVDVEKPLFEVCGRPMVDHVYDALRESATDTVYAVTSPHAPATREHVPEPRIDAPGEGYVSDLGYALDRVEPPVLTVTADLPLLDGDAVDTVLDAFAGRSLAVYVPLERKRELGVSVDTTTTVDGRDAVPAGVNVVAEDHAEDTFMTEDVRFAINVNRNRDARIAEVTIDGP